MFFQDRKLSDRDLYRHILFKTDPSSGSQMPVHRLACLVVIKTLGQSS